MTIRDRIRVMFGEDAEIDSGPRPECPDFNLPINQTKEIFGRLVERKNFQLRPHLQETEAYASLRASKSGVSQIPVIFAKDPKEPYVYAFLLAEDLQDLLDGK
jgi:hypothetical protein